MFLICKKRRALTIAIVSLLCGNLATAQKGYLAGDFHQHTTYTDGSYSIHHMMKKNNEFGLNWWANSEHGGGFPRNGNVSGIDVDTTIYWDQQSGSILGDTAMNGGHQVMWRWQMLLDSSFTQVVANRTLYPANIIIQSYEMNVPGHEHGSLGIIANQFDANPNCAPLAQFEYMFDDRDGDQSGGATMGWAKSTKSGHEKTLESIEWLQANYPNESYLVLAHPERKKKYTIADFRDMNNAGPDVCFGFESMPGHQKNSNRGGYSSSADGAGVYGGCGIYAAEIGGLWDAMLSEGRGFWLFANSDFHSEGGDFYPGEYQKTYTYVQETTAQGIVDGLRSGNSWIVEGDLIDELDFHIETINRDDNIYASMGETADVLAGKSLKICIIARDPQGANHNTYSDYTHPELNHIDLIMGKVSGIVNPDDANYNVSSVATTSVIARFDANGGETDSNGLVSTAWESLEDGYVKITYVVPNVTEDCYFRLRGSNLGLNVENETDGAGNPLADALKGANTAEKAFADLWFYSNPVFVKANKIINTSFQISSANDDLEEKLVSGSGDWGSSDLEFGSEGGDASSAQLIGLRFADLDIARSATITSAFIQFEVDETKPVDPTVLSIWSEDADNAAAFEQIAYPLSTRAMNTDTITWAIPAGECNTINEKYNSPDLSSLVQAQVDRAGWESGNAMTIFLQGSGRRCVESYDGESSAAAKMFVTYKMSDEAIREMQIADSIAAALQAKLDSTWYPVATITPAYKETVVGKTVEIVVGASDLDGEISKVEFFMNDSLISVDTEYPYSISYIAEHVEGVKISAVAYDNENLASNEVISIIVVRSSDYFKAGYFAGDFHQHTTYTDGSFSYAHMMKKNNEFGLDWWANSEHGGAFPRNGRISGTDLGTIIYWDETAPENILGDITMNSGHRAMWRWQMLKDSVFGQNLLNRALYTENTLIQSYEMNVPGHEHGSLGIIANQFDSLPNCYPLAQFEYMFDNSDRDISGGANIGWTKSALSGHAKTLEAIEWLQANYPTQSYLVPAHPERKRRYTISDFRDMNSAGPDVCFGFESMSGHQKSGNRGGYGSGADGGGTFGGCGFYTATIGGLWDAMLSEGRNFWLFASSDFHSEGGDFYPGEYQKTYTYAKNKSAQALVDGLRSGNTWVVEGDLIDSLDFNIQATSKSGKAIVASMGSHTSVETDEMVTVSIIAHDPQGANYNVYSDYTHPELNHIDLIMGQVSDMLDTSDANYNVPSVATTSVIARFDAQGGVEDANGLISQAWEDLGNGFVKMIYTFKVSNSCYFRLRGTNLGLNVDKETDGAGNPLPDALMGSNNAEKTFADLWFYSNPIFVNAVNKSYSLEDVETLCSDDSFCIPLSATDSIAEGLGFDITITYDTALVTPTGKVTLANDLIDASYVSELSSVVDSAGLMNIAVFLNISAPAETSFNGIGEILCVEFEKKNSFVGETKISATLIESFATSSKERNVESAVCSSVNDSLFVGKLVFWKGATPLVYNADSPAEYAITTIVSEDSSFSTYPDINGFFDYNTAYGENFSINRTIDDSVNVHPVINSMDAARTLQVVLMKNKFVPTVQQIIAMDVNLDGKVTAGDVSQINQRGVGIRTDFIQKENAAKDWLFVEKSALATDEYKISANYPINDGIGYSKFNVPTVPSSLTAPRSDNGTDCAPLQNETYQGILLGDIDASFVSIPNDGKLKSDDANEIVFELNNATYDGETVTIPVSFSYIEEVEALDFDIVLNKDVISSVISVNHPSSYNSDWKYNEEKNILSLGIFNLDFLSTNAITITFATEKETKLKSDDFSCSLALLNGKSVQLNTKETSDANGVETSAVSVSVYPNPASSVVIVSVSDNATVEIIDVNGKVVVTAEVTAGENTINITNLAPGVYTIKAISANFADVVELIVE